MLKTDEIKELNNILDIIYKTKKDWHKVANYIIPYYEYLENNPTYWFVFKNRDENFKKDVQNYIDNIFLVNKLKQHKTNWDKMLYRIYLNNIDDFMEFRKLNRYEENKNTKRFKELEKKFAKYFFEAEDKLWNINKYDIVLNSFHSKIYWIFPYIDY